ncbi:MAG: response regulator [Desulfarculus sp.]|nr:response regulator [Desulfarculus sp.]
MSGPQAELTVLLVDDEEGFVQTLARRLSRRGMTVRTALSGPLALEELERGPVAVVVLDLKMAGMDGLATLKQIKALYPRLPVILLTGHGSLASMQDILALGAYDYLSKPCDLQTLLERIQAAAEASPGEADNLS